MDRQSVTQGARRQTATALQQRTVALSTVDGLSTKLSTNCRRLLPLQTTMPADRVTIHGTNFGATQADPDQDYVFFVDGDTSWGAPFDGATFHIDSWSATAITFTVPTPSGDNGIWQVTPGTTATVTVNTSAGPSNTVPLPITG